MKNGMKNIANTLVDLVFPPRCVVTGELVDEQGLLASSVWKKIRFIRDPQCNLCGYPFDFKTDTEDPLCGRCQKEKPIFDKARSAVVYDENSREIILRFKHADQLHMVHAFIPWLRQAGAEIIGDVDFVMPVPLHHWRFLKRRYNQAALIAQVLAKNIGKTYLPDSIKRTRVTRSQGEFDFKDRFKNVKNVFAVNPKQGPLLAGRNVLLIDDVYTTGATVSSCAKALKKMGAGKVYILTVARVVKAMKI